MTTHISVRLCWHDSGWNGKICKDPKKNKYCIALPHIRESKNEENECKFKCASLADLDTDRCNPPCKAEVGVFSEHKYPITFHHPIEGWKVPSTDEEFPPYSLCPAPYRWFQHSEYNKIIEKEGLQLRSLTKEDYSGSWIGNVKIQQKILNVFWDKIEDKKSFVVFYTNSSPVAEDARRIIIGVGRILSKEKLCYFGNSQMRPGPNPVWQRMVKHNYPEEGFRLPYQEYLEQGVDPSHIVLTAPDDFIDEFKYVAEHVSDSAMLSLMEQLNIVIKRIQEDIAENRIKLSSDWNKHGKWVQTAINELWSNRGQYPGIGSVLQFLGFNRGVSYHQSILSVLEEDGEDVLTHVIDILDGKKESEKEYKQDYENVKRKWIPYSRNEDIKKLLEILMRFEISERQVENIIKKDLRYERGITYDEKELTDNPYLIAESDKGLFSDKGDIISPRIPLDIVDQALIPTFNYPNKYQLDDDRRVRAIMIEVLTKSSREGDTLLSFHDVIIKTKDRFPGERACIPDPYLINQNKTFYEQRLEFIGDKNEFIALKVIRNYEREVSAFIKRMIDLEDNTGSEQPEWEKLLNEHIGKVEETKLDKEQEIRARTEKINSLKTLFTKKFSILTGRAGTGKTKLLKILIEGLKVSEKQTEEDFLLLAPTGKARVRIRTETGIKAMTIHQHLIQNDWLDDNYEFKTSGGDKEFAKTVVVDECSMMSLDLFATLLKSLDIDNIQRLILVGDPNQLPPIGPGRPFDDIIHWLKENQQYEDNLTNLNERVRHPKKENICLKLADGFLRDMKSKDVEEIYSLIEQNKLTEEDNLNVLIWNTEEELQKELEKVLNILKINDYDSYKQSIGITDDDVRKVESWQVLSPVKQKEVFGTSSLNVFFQNKFLHATLNRWRHAHPFSKYTPKPFGKTKDIVHEDKVIQNINTSRLFCQPKNPENYVANGEIGFVKFYGKKPKQLKVEFSTQKGYVYCYNNGESSQSVEINLDLAYAITIHKAQGSDFNTVILIIPENTINLSMEMMYTALTRFKEKTYLLIQSGTKTLQKYRKANSSETDRRNTYLFKVVVRDDVSEIPYAENRIHTTKWGFLVRSKSEVTVADSLYFAGIKPLYEEKLCSKSNVYDYKLPDFTFTFKGKKYYWEHLGMLGLESYRKDWENKLEWYKKNEYEDCLIISQDGEDGSINSQEIDRIIEEKLKIRIDRTKQNKDTI